MRTLRRQRKQIVANGGISENGGGERENRRYGGMGENMA